MVGFESPEVPVMSSLGVAVGLRTEEADDNPILEAAGLSHSASTAASRSAISEPFVAVVT